MWVSSALLSQMKQKGSRFAPQPELKLHVIIFSFAKGISLFFFLGSILFAKMDPGRTKNGEWWGAIGAEGGRTPRRRSQPLWSGAQLCLLPPPPCPLSLPDTCRTTTWSTSKVRRCLQVTLGTWHKHAHTSITRPHPSRPLPLGAWCEPHCSQCSELS